MEERPRETTLWKHQEEFFAEAMATALADPEIDGCWDYTMIKLHAMLKQPPHVWPTETEIRVVAAPLTKLLRERVPALEHAYESNLDLRIIGLMGQMIQTVASEIDITIPETNMKRLLPDNPIRIWHDSTTGDVTLDNVEAAMGPHYMRYFMQIESYLRSLAPPGEPGRPKGLPKPKKSGKRSLPPDLALQVHEAKLDGKTFSQIVRDVLRTTIPSDYRARERLRAKVNRLNARGVRLKLKKSSIS